MSYRNPPKPIHYDNFLPGQCRFCGEPILKADGTINVRANWHKDGCLEAYKTLYWPAHTRKAVFKRDRGQCAKCPRKFDRVRGAWHVDHIRPLVEAKGDLDYWRMPNLQSLCEDCHKAKTALEATMRAEARRAALAQLSNRSDEADATPENT